MANAILAIGLASLATPVAAHIVKQVGPYTVALGWVHEPTYVGQLNAVQVVIKDARGNPVSDLSADDLKVVVSTAGQQSDPMALAPTFDEDTGLGIPGDYEAPLIPTSPGDYTFHVTGTIHSTKIDETATSSDTTFVAAVDPGPIQYGPSEIEAPEDGHGDGTTQPQPPAPRRIDGKRPGQPAPAKPAPKSEVKPPEAPKSQTETKPAGDKQSSVKGKARPGTAQLASNPADRAGEGLPTGKAKKPRPGSKLAKAVAPKAPAKDSGAEPQSEARKPGVPGKALPQQRTHALRDLAPTTPATAPAPAQKDGR